MLNKAKEFENKSPQHWEFLFLSGFHGKSPDDFYRIKIEKTDSTCDTCKSMNNRFFLKSEGVKGKNYPPFHPNCRCHAVDKDGKSVVLLSKEFINSMMKSYGFSAKEARLISEAYRLLLWEVNDKQMEKQEKIHHIFSILAALCQAYSGAELASLLDGITFSQLQWLPMAGTPSTGEAKSHLLKLGMSDADVETLFNAINTQHVDKSEKFERDFAHEIVEYAIFANDSKLHKGSGLIAGNLDALGSYKGDVFSGKMGYADMNSDIDAINIYNRMLSDDNDFLEIIAEYNSGVNNGKINRFDEFLEFFGSGDAEQGLKYIEEDLNTISLGAYLISVIFDKENNREITKEGFIRYLKKGMSK